ncbi:MAG: XRE family transcriptional regulator [Candidatus Sigynarchaeota archaeon]
MKTDPNKTARKFVLPTGDDLRQLRVQKGLSQADLAKMAGEGFSQPLIARIEKGSINPPLKKVQRLLDVLYSDVPTSDTSALDIAAKPVIVLRTGDTVAKAIEVLNEKGVSQVPVIDARGDVVGSVTDKRLTVAIIERGRTALSMDVKSVLEVPFPELDPNASINDVQDRLASAPAILVKDGKNIKGIITKSDLLRYFGSQQS